MLKMSLLGKRRLLKIFDHISIGGPYGGCSRLAIPTDAGFLSKALRVIGSDSIEISCGTS